MIKTAVVIDDTSADNEAGIGKAVTIFIPEDGVEETYTIVSTMRQNSLKGLISVESPLGRALLRHKAGDTVQVRVSDAYSYEAQIRSVEKSPLAEEAEIRHY